MKGKFVFTCQTNIACKFSQIRKLLNQKWLLMEDNRDGTSIVGSEEAPLNID